MPGEVSALFLNKLTQKRAEVRAQAEALLLRAKEQRGGDTRLLEDEAREWEVYRETLKGRRRGKSKNFGRWAVNAICNDPVGSG